MSGGTSAATLIMAAGAGVSAMGAYRQSEATKAGYEYQSAVNRNNAIIAEWQAQDALQRGQTAEQRQRLKAAQLKGSQRAALAARGVALDEGSPLAILQDTEFMAEQDALTIRDNAAREAWGYRTQSRNYTNDASMLNARADAESPFGAAATTLLTGAGTVASHWYNRGAKR